MTFTFKLSKRLAQAYAAVIALLTLPACGDLSLTDLAKGISEAPVRSIIVSPETDTLVPGATTQLTAILLDSTGQEVTPRPVTWSTDAPLVALVSPAGAVKGLVAGRATITAESEGQSGHASVTVSVPGEDGGGGNGAGPRVGYFVAPNGSSTADGSEDDPWDLATALSGAGGRIQPGDTVWMRGGTYRGFFRSTLTGEPGRPIVVRQYPGERAIIDPASTGSGSALNVRGAWSVFWGFEITNSFTGRSASTRNSNLRPHAVTNYASHTKYINLVVHDAGVAFYTETNYSDIEITGCIFYNNGWQGPQRGAGHALYLKSNTGPVVLRDNVIFNQFGYGVHAFTDYGSGKINNIVLERNVTFNNGALSDRSRSSNILLGGDDYTTGGVLKNNIAYVSPGVRAVNLMIGWGSLQNGTVELRGNQAVGGSPVLDFGHWKTVTVADNSFIGADSMIALRDGTPSGHAWSGNVHQRDPSARAWMRATSSYTFSGWRSATGLASADKVQAGLPSTTSVAVWANSYESGRLTVVVLNWARLSAAAAVIPTGALAPGDRYEVRNVQKMFGAPLASGTFTGGPIMVPMTGVTPPVPVGLSSSRAPKTGPDFDVFIVTKLD